MCPPKKEANEFALQVNESILSGNLASIPGQIAKFEEKGHSVFYEVIPKKQLSDSFEDFWEKKATEAKAMGKGRPYQGTLIFTPVMNSNNILDFWHNKDHPLTRAYTFIAERGLKVNDGKCCLGHYYDRNSVLSKDENIYAMMVYG